MNGRVEIQNLGFAYSGRETDKIFSGITVSLEPGEVFCLLGPNGSGKSTLLKCIAGLLKPDTGTVSIDGRGLTGQPRELIARKLGFVPQSLVSTFPFKVEDIVTMGRASRIPVMSLPSSKDRDNAWKAMERVGISHLGARPCTRLSGGEWQLVLMARALAQSPHVLLLDEPTSHLDLGNQIKILEVVDTLSKEGMTILMATHFPDHGFLSADLAGILKNGTLTALGDPDQVLSETILQDTYGIQIKVIQILDGINRKICVPVMHSSPVMRVSKLS
jgi:iron complex transport system ATP-binding protein